MSARILHLHRATLVDEQPDTVLLADEPRPLMPYDCTLVTGDGQRLQFTTLAESLGAAELQALSSAYPHGVRFMKVVALPVLQLVEPVSPPAAEQMPEGHAMDEYQAAQAARLDRHVQLAALIPAGAVGTVLAIAVAVVSALVISGGRPS